MALLPARNILDGSALPVTSQMKTALGSLRDFMADLLGTDSSNKAAARTALGVASSGANTDITSLTGLTTPLSMALGGTGMVNGFVSVKAASGYQRLPSGLIIQWGVTQVSAPTTWATALVTLPISYPNAHLACVVSNRNNPALATTPITWAAEAVSLSQISISSIASQFVSGSQCHWVSIGH